MPSARELLEQADALMRRNRNTLADDIPVLTEVAPAMPEAQVLRGRGAQARPAVPAPAPLAEEGDTIPTLTERVESVAAPEPALPAAVVAAAEEGEPSDWLQREAGEPSVTGEIPDSVLIVPPAEEASVVAEDFVFEDSPAPEAASNASRDEPPLAIAEEIELLPPVDPGPAEEAFDEEFAEAAELQAAFADEPRAAESHALRDAAAASEGAPPAVNEALEEFADAGSTLLHTREMANHADLAHEAEVVALTDGVAETGERAPYDTKSAEIASSDELAEIASSDDRTPGESAHLVEQPPEVEALPAAAAFLAPVAAMAAPVAAAAQAAPAALDDAARWDGVAEEIRMQVLQRIDIFTDTGLREQLALRLQPIVDRASADLVATINLHVGELLRAYVAEAIEREIEIWRRSH